MSLLGAYFVAVFCFTYSSDLKTETICSSETSVDVQGTTRRYIPRDKTLQNTAMSWIDHTEGMEAGRSGKLMLVLASTVIIGSEPRGTHDHILLSHDSGCCARANVYRNACCTGYCEGKRGGGGEEEEEEEEEEDGDEEKQKEQKFKKNILE
jgi:hypothetical protein